MLLKDTLKYRNAWLGLAMLWVVFFHAEIDIGFNFLQKIKIFGYGGVDICLFASGVGCYCSLSSNPDIGAFMKKRLLRLMPTYLCFMVIWLVYIYFVRGISVQAMLGNILAVQNFTGLGNDFNWYISAILLFYFFAPYLKILTDHTSLPGKVFFFCFLILLSVCFWSSDTLVITAVRLPIFWLGMVFAKQCQTSQKMTRKQGLLFAGAFVLGVLMLGIFHHFFYDDLWSKGLWWYPFIFVTPGLCVFISYVMKLISKVPVLKYLKIFLDTIGTYSFEVYLIHIPLVSVLRLCIDRLGLQKIAWIVWCSGAGILAVGCVILRHTATYMSKIILKRNKGKEQL